MRASPGLALPLLLLACKDGSTTNSDGGGGSGGIGGGGGQAGVGGAGGGGSGGGGSGGGRDGGPQDSKPDGPSASSAWVMGYYAGYERDLYPIEAIDWSGITHLMVAFYLPRMDGTLDPELFVGGEGPALGRALVAAAHGAGRKVIASIGGADTRAGWVASAGTARRSTFVANLVTLMKDYGYDGLDLDWEPFEAADEPLLEVLAADLRKAAPAAILTMPVGYVNANFASMLGVFGRLAGTLDRINVMSYGMAGAYPGWKSWHTSALHHVEAATPTSIESSVDAYLAVGVPAAKLGFGVGFYGLCYTPPVSGPAQDLGGSDLVASDGVVSYARIMSSYFDAAARRWDATALVPYLSFAKATGPQGCGFVSYDDAESIAAKGAYLHAKGLGGVIVWTVNQGYLPGAPAGMRSPLVTALRTAVLE